METKSSVYPLTSDDIYSFVDCIRSVRQLNGYPIDLQIEDDRSYLAFVPNVNPPYQVLIKIKSTRNGDGIGREAGKLTMDCSLAILDGLEAVAGGAAAISSGGLAIPLAIYLWVGFATSATQCAVGAERMRERLRNPDSDSLYKRDKDKSNSYNKAIAYNEKANALFSLERAGTKSIKFAYESKELRNIGKEVPNIVKLDAAKTLAEQSKIVQEVMGKLQRQIRSKYGSISFNAALGTKAALDYKKEEGTTEQDQFIDLLSSQRKFTIEIMIIENDVPPPLPAPPGSPQVSLPASIFLPLPAK